MHGVTKSQTGLKRLNTSMSLSGFELLERRLFARITLLELKYSLPALERANWPFGNLKLNGAQELSVMLEP